MQGVYSESTIANAAVEVNATPAKRDISPKDLVRRIRRSPETLVWQETVDWLRRELKCDRALVYVCDSPTSGKVIAASQAKGWTPMVAETIPMIAFGMETAAEYLEKELCLVEDASAAGVPPYQAQLLSCWQVKTSAAAAIVSENEDGEEILWGLLVVQQCHIEDSPATANSWQTSQIHLLHDIARNLGSRVQINALRERSMAQIQAERKVSRIVERLRQQTDRRQLLQMVTQEVRQLLKVDRTVIYQFAEDWSGQFVAESLGNEDLRPVDLNCWTDSYLCENKGGRYRHGDTSKVADIHEANLSACYIDLLEEMGVRSYTVVPILSGTNLWGLLGAYQSKVRQWSDQEVGWIKQIVGTISASLRQAEYSVEIDRQSRVIASLHQKERDIRQAIFRLHETTSYQSFIPLAARDLRALLDVDRLAIARFTSENDAKIEFTAVRGDWRQERLSGENWLSVLHPAEDFTAWLKVWGEGEMTPIKGSIDDHSLTLSEREHLRSLGIADYAIVPVYAGKWLWGWLGAYHYTDGVTSTQFDLEIQQYFANRIGSNINNIEIVQQLELQTQQTIAISQREKEEREKLQQQAIALLRSIRPALDGDLTVRLPITQNEIGTIADAYNNTLKSLQEIVTDVQSASSQVAKISSESRESIARLTMRSQEQLNELDRALIEVEEVAAYSKKVTEDVREINNAVRQANYTVKTGDNAMQRTVESITQIRDTVAQTGQKIKQLSESSQKISKVVSLIGNFATQTNVLAMNAAIEATRAGEYGRGFAVVADEVRALARQSANAAKDIENLVAEIQTETSEVSAAMERGIAEVVGGSNLVSETQISLQEIVVATNRIEALVGEIDLTIATQTTKSQQVTQTVTLTAIAATQTSAETELMAVQIEQLESTAITLQENAQKFKVK